MERLDRAEDERLVVALRGGDQDAFGRLFDRWYDRVHDLARRVTRDDALAADVAQDAFLAAWQRLDGLDDPASFGGWLLRIARNRALDVVRSPTRARTRSDDDMSTLVDEEATAGRLGSLADPADVAGDREVQELVWSAAATLGERDLTALDLSLRHGLEPAEIGEVLGINRNAANQLVHRMRSRLATAVGSRVLWRGGRPACAALRQALADDGLEGFDSRAVRVADRHADACERCAERRATRLDPAKLFAAVPITVAPVFLKAKAAAALDAAGVPMGGSAASGPGPDSTGADESPPSAPASSRSGSWWRRHGRALARTGLALVVVALVVVAVAVDRLDDGGLDEAQSTSSPTADTTTNEATTTSVEGGITVEVVPDEPGVVVPAPTPAPDAGGSPPPPDPGPAPPPPPPAPPEGSIQVSPPAVADAHPRVTASWTSAQATSVTVSGPGLSAAGLSGSQSFCPDGSSSSFCTTAPGTYTYVLTMTGPGGTTQRTATLTVG